MTSQPPVPPPPPPPPLPLPSPLTWRTDLYHRLTSRKFLLSVAAALTIVVAWAKGALPGPWAAGTVAALTVVYTLVEGFVDASQG